jgi:YfiH family protein
VSGISEACEESGYRVWRDARDGIEVRFVGRGPAGERDAVLCALEPNAPPVAWLKQIHSSTALPAAAGACGEGDGLFTEASGLALAVVTADCVPVLLAASSGRIAAAHAGWRGIAGGVLAATLKAAAGGPEERWTAWIGPAIGACCYEVGEEVAEQVVAASAPEVARVGAAGKPHLDLARAVRIQLERLGVREVIEVPACTRCDSESLWSYRRDGRGAGRNLAYIWRQ